ncbi:MAG: hypothetical protein LWX51_02440 [Deltaproteobacteria bacterium]|jgi:hypothetical protein|nr:hypothetical protein [Deltaproteobacteria bacterium]
MGWNPLSKEITVIVGGLFVALTSYLLVKMGIIITSIAWLICTAYLLSIACIYLYRCLINKNIQCAESTKTTKSFSQETNEQTCDWIQKYGVWQHKINGLYYCPYCAPNPSLMSNDNNKSWYCPKCKNGFGEGDVFNVNNEIT